MPSNEDPGAPPTVVDVAKAASVSVGTVSNALRRPELVRPETRQRVEAAIAKLDYRPNRVAQSLSHGRTRLIAALVPEVDNPFFAELVQGFERALGATQHTVIFATAHEDVKMQERYLEGFRERRVDGILMVAAADTNISDIASLSAAIPLVVVDRTIHGWEGDCVVGDSSGGMELAVKHLTQLGHRRIALINGEAKLSTARERESAFERSLAARGLKPFEMSQGSFTIESGVAQTGDLLSRERPPTAIVAGNDLLAMAAIAAATERGVRVPDTLSVVGYDDIPYARLVSPPLTTVRQPARTMGVEAARLLLGRLEGKKRPSRRLVLRSELVVRHSTTVAPHQHHLPGRRVTSRSATDGSARA